MRKLEELFGAQKPIIGMIHLARRQHGEMINDALKEMRIYEEEGVSGAIVEDYHQFISIDDVCSVMRAIRNANFKITVGVNILQNPGLSAAVSNSYKGKFVQYDSVQGYFFDDDMRTFGQFVLGGVGFKYQPESGNSLEFDLREGMGRCDAIVTTGSGTGVETPIEKLAKYRKGLDKISEGFPLIVGAGVNLDNVKKQLEYADGAIVGSYFKPRGDTYAMVDRGLVRGLMDAVREVRKD
ncbi:membrane biogenesis protein [Candidatus Pacearchaeota archaeon]|nr:membrane biogenesis protein [Candidatus Pacearchaeota archaeon]